MPQHFESRVRDLSSDGLGVVDGPEGRIFFVRGAWPGDEGLFEVERVERRYGFARLIDLKKKSPDRVEPRCASHGFGVGKCGGCSWMIASYPAQLAQKSHRLRFSINRAQLVESEATIKEIWGATNPWAYRNRAQFKTNGTQLGFVSEQSHEIVDVAECAVLNPKMGELLSTMRAQLPQNAWVPTPPHHWNFIDVDDEVATETVALNRRRPFRQGNSEQNLRMTEWLRSKIAGLDTSSPVLELFAGAGNFTRVFAAQGFKRIAAVEYSKAALAAIDLPGVTCVESDLTRYGSFNELARRFPETEILFLDPPREGAKGIGGLVARLPKLKRVFYVSCDTATFVRDAADLKKQGARLVEVQPLDLFPQTPHLEVLGDFVLGDKTLRS